MVKKYTLDATKCSSTKELNVAIVADMAKNAKATDTAASNKSKKVKKQTNKPNTTRKTTDNVIEDTKPNTPISDACPSAECPCTCECPCECECPCRCKNGQKKQTWFDKFIGYFRRIFK